MGNNRNTVEAGRAKKAYEFAEKGIKNANYKNYVKSIPSMIKTNGMAATFAFMNAKQNGYEIIYNQVEEWLSFDDCMVKAVYLKDEYKGNSLIKKLTLMNSSDYRAVTNEVMALFTWLRRFAEGLEKDTNKNSGEKNDREV